MIDFLVSVGNIFIDDIITWTEEIHLGVTGGAGLHVLSGCRVWNQHLGIVASAGEDFRPFLNELHELGIDTGGIQYDQEKTNRAWQIFQPGELRVEILRDPRIKINQAIPNFEQLDQKYKEAAGYHFSWNGNDRDLFTLLEEIKKLNPDARIVYEPSPKDCHKPVDFFKQLFVFIDGFSPSQSEGQSILKIDQPENIIAEFVGMGSQCTALRLGREGSMAGTSTGRLYKIPAAEAKVVDVTGAGNAYSGGFLCGLTSHRPIQECLAMASVSASFEIEQYGLSRFSDEMKPVRDARFSHVLKNTTILK